MCTYIQETILLKKISKNVKGVVVPLPPPPPETSQNWVLAAYMISQKLFILEA